MSKNSAFPANVHFSTFTSSKRYDCLINEADSKQSKSQVERNMLKKSIYAELTLITAVMCFGLLFIGELVSAQDRPTPFRLRPNPVPVSNFDDLKQSAEAGDVNAQFTLGAMFQIGKGVPQDYAEAAKWLHLAAEQGHANAQIGLGMIYESGSGVPQDATEAGKWYRLAAEQGVAEAQLDLGRLYDSGRGVPQNFSKAVTLYRLAAEQGHAAAQGYLSRKYYEGEGVPQDPVLGYAWLNIAAANGDKTAIKARDTLQPLLRYEVLRQAQQISSKCMESNYTDCGY